jgi:hypothetical protein
LPAPLTRDGAAQAAHDELSKHVYQQARPSIEQQVVRAIERWLIHAYHRIVDATPGGAVGLLVIIAVIAGVAVVFTQRRGVSGRRRPGEESFDLPADVSSDQLRSEADALAARGEWAQAVRARLRAIVRGLEERGVIDPRPGRTATEVAVEAGAVRPDLREGLRQGARTFGEIWYGRRPATAGDDASLREVDAAVRARPPREPVATANADGYVAAPR